MSPKDESHYTKMEIRSKQFEAIARTLAAVVTLISAALGFFAFKKPLEDHSSKLQTSTPPAVSGVTTSGRSTNSQVLRSRSPAATDKAKHDDHDNDDDDDDDHD
ncbi:hypothetical protein G7B40_041265 [Aetokthonos hydrillicola Thurmond2011]|jgi:hypothetical protein|uniref:Uncharacterized protein n=1 Tax=Aetokthonos hydrillicola Thurmond2011 TaxID=2712845 RepID=A0AAP5MDR1_9CYAN|nr:hypothetical protein [Aetokthonos hydrillicola]MBO3461859.1 hypothetical protein [Aetokthonos hydrillicola CCALA 1050]MBW4588891.1 hypothetical protein [Aetokthonos hydrillicola CCALA 1050]MDR9900917.1 hypothetical protein [Aetokthonos hydrillicola Thurmond2011]